MFTVDASDLTRLAADLGKASGAVAKDAQGVVAKGALNIKNDWRARSTVSAGAHGRLYPLAIDYDLRFSLSGPSAEIGPDSGKPQGGMGRGFEYGSINQPPHLDFLAAAEAEAPRFEKALAAVLGGIL